MPKSLFETFLMMCRSTSALSPVVSMQFSPNYLITMTAHIAGSNDAVSHIEHSLLGGALEEDGDVC